MSATTPTNPAASGYTRTAKVFHWTVAVLVLGMIPVGLSLNYLPEGPVQDTVYAIHKSTGFVVLVLMLGRLAWRLASPPPRHQPELPGWQKAAATANHWALYAILLAMPILGWAGSNAFGAPVSVYGLFTLPDLVSKDEPLSKTLLGLHATLGFVAAGLILIHIGAALHHRYVRRDAVLSRMT